LSGVAVAALVLAAGRGERLGLALPKAFVPALGRALVVRSLEAMAAVSEIDRVVPVIGPLDLARYQALETSHIPKLAEAVAGGAERQDSMRAGLESLPEQVEWVAVHDAARCLVSRTDVVRVIAAARESGAAILGEPVRDTIKRVRGGEIVETPERSECWAAQTPQVFRAQLLREALAKADAEGVVGSDEAQLVERLGAPVRLVQSDGRNLKITLPADLAIAESWLREREGESA
jgi:2-C-methyl-D-erythritol 4-phosphate cytidylyltransferase